MGEETFLSSNFSQRLILAHGALLTVFILTRWTRPSGMSVPDLLRRIFRPIPARLEQMISLRVTPTFTMTTMLSSVAIGMLCARSLHYQFYAYIAWATPFLLWRSGLHPLLIYLVWGVQEWTWNIYPSTDISSATVVGCLALQVLGVWWGTRSDFVDADRVSRRLAKSQHQE